MTNNASGSGEPASAICQYLKGTTETMLMLTTHARGAMERAMLGSVAAECIRRSGVPLYLYYAPGAADAQVLPQILTPGLVIEAISPKPKS